MLKRTLIKFSCLTLLLGGAALALDAVPGTDPGLGIPYCAIDSKDSLTAKDASANKGWYVVFNGTQAMLDKYWFKPTNTNHGGAGTWIIQGDTLLASTQVGGVGGLLHTKHQYRNVEIKLHIKPGFGNDGGLFMRSNQMGKSYQMVIDYLGGKTVGGVWGEAIHSISHKPYYFSNDSTIRTGNTPWIGSAATNWVPAPGAAMTDWKTKIWNKKGYNWLHAQIFEDDPPRIKTYINGYAITDYKDNVVEAQNKTGYVTLQIHTGAGAWTGGNNYYKATLIREIGTDGKPLASYPEWETAAAPLIAANSCPKISWTSSAIDNSSLTNSIYSSIKANVLDNQNIQLHGFAETEYQLRVTDLTGKTVYLTNGNAGNYSYQVNLPSNGIYVANMSGNGFNSTIKIFPQK